MCVVTFCGICGGIPGFAQNLCVFSLRYTVGESGMGPAPVFILFSFYFIFRQLTPRDASPCVCLPHSFIWFYCCPPFPPPSFLFRCVAHSLSLSLSSYLGCLTLLIWLPFLPYACDVVVLCLFRSCLSFVSWGESLPGEDVLCRLLSRPHPYVCFLPVCLFCFIFL